MVHSVIAMLPQDFMIQGGDFVKGDGTGKRAVYRVDGMYVIAAVRQEHGQMHKRERCLTLSVHAPERRAVSGG